MADKDITIGIKTSGAQQAVSDLKLVEGASLAVTQGQLSMGNSLGPRNDFGRAAMIKDVQAISDKARVAEFAFYDLGAEIKKTATVSEKFSEGTKQVGKSSSNAATSMLMLSQGFEDAQYGMRGVLNNIPGLVMSLGGTAGIAGAISIAAVSFSMLYEWFGKTEEKASDVEERISAAADAMGQIEVDRFERVGNEIEGAAEAANALKQAFEETHKAEGDFTAAVLSNSAKIAQAEQNIETALGYQVDRYKELQYLAEVEAEKRRAATNQAIEAEQMKLAKAQETAALAADTLSKTILRASDEKANLVTLRGQLEVLREQKYELEKIIERKKNLNEPFLPGLKGLEQYKNEQFSTFGGTAEGAGLRTAAKAREILESGLFQSKLQGTQQRVDQLEQIVEKLTAEGSGAVDKAQNALNAATTKVEDVSGAVEMNISRLEETLASDDLLARSQTLVESQKVLADDLKSAMAGVETYNEKAKEAKETITKAAEFGGITANETQAVAQSFAALMGQINAGNASSKESLTQMIQLQSRLIEEQTQQKGEIRELYKRFDAIQSRIR